MEQILSVSQFNLLLNEIFSNLGEFAVEGEIVSMKRSKNNAVFIELKDPKDSALLKLSNFAPWVEGLNSVSEGMHVIVYGKPEIYSRYGSFSLKVRKIAPQGEGALRVAFENLKKALEAEGLFNVERKRELPEVVTKIALISGADSAAYNDFVKILAEGGCSLDVDFYPVLVQGPNSEYEVAGAIKAAQKTDVDCIVVTRGGGSLEDLASFNSEIVGRAVFASKLPVIVGVGHEVDTCIADMIADIRASTPSQAAYYLIAQNNSFLERAERSLDNLDRYLEKLLPDEALLESELARLEKLVLALLPAPDFIDYCYRMISMGLGNIENKIVNSIVVCDDMPKLERIIAGRLQTIQAKLDSELSLLKAYNPKNVLNKGYALMRNDKEKYISGISDIEIGEALWLTLKDGELETIVKNKKRN